MRLPPWLWRACRSKWTKRLFIASPFLLMAAIVSFYGIANLWGRQCLQREIAAMRADGLPLTFEELFGPVPPAEEDVFQHPAILREMEKADSDTRLWHLDAMLIPGLKKRANWEATPELGKLSDVRLLCDPPRTGENEAEVAAELLQIIEPQSREFDACVEGLHRPVFHWGLTRDELPARCLPLNKLRYFAEDRARLRLVAGQTHRAATDVKTAFAICERLGSAHGNMVAFISLALGEKQTSTVVWEGIRRGAWTERQLAEFQSQLGAVDLHRVFWDVVPTELIYGKQALEALSPDDFHAREWSEIGYEFWEAGKDRDTSEIKTLTGEAWEKAKPLGLKIRELVQGRSRIRKWHVRFRDRGQLPGIHDYDEWKSFDGGDGLYRAARLAHTRRALLLCGIALERYRIKHGTAPKNLEMLVPEFLPEMPRDVCDDQPLRYQILPDGGVHVWSIWPSGKDEGGMPNYYDTRNTVWTTGQIPGLTEKSYNGR